MSFDFETKRANTTLGELYVSRVADDGVTFKAPFVENGMTTGTLTGTVNRYTGFTEFFAKRTSEPNVYLFWYSLTCRLARPLF